MGLGCLDDTFSGVETMNIRQGKLEIDVPFLLNDAHVVKTGVVVKDCRLTLWPSALSCFMMEE